MQPDPVVPEKGRSRFAPDRAAPDVGELQATCHRQTLVIDKLSDAISALRSDLSALEAENADLRDAAKRLPAQALGLHPADPGEMLERVLSLDVQAPAAARLMVADFLHERIPARLVDSAQLIISELVSNSLRQNAAPYGQAVVVRVTLEGASWRLEVEDPGGGGVLAPDPERAAAGRLGMNLVQRLSECWGVEHAAQRGTRAWAYLPPSARSNGNGAHPPH